MSGSVYQTVLVVNWVSKKYQYMALYYGTICKLQIKHAFWVLNYLEYEENYMLINKLQHYAPCQMICTIFLCVWQSKTPPKRITYYILWVAVDSDCGITSAFVLEWESARKHSKRVTFFFFGREWELERRKSEKNNECGVEKSEFLKSINMF